MPCIFALVLLLLLPATGQAERALHLAIAPLEPYADEALPGKGWVPVALAQALKSTDYTLDLHFMPFRRALSITQQGEADIMLPLYWSESRNKTLLFSEPLGISQTALFYLAERPLKYTAIEDLTDLRIAVLRGATVSPTFDRAHHFTRIEATSYEQLVKMLLAGRADALVGDVFVVLALCERLTGNRDALHQISPPLVEPGVHLAISRKLPDAEPLLASINQQLAQLKSSGDYAALLAAYGIVYQADGNRLLVKSQPETSAKPEPLPDELP